MSDIPETSPILLVDNNGDDLLLTQTAFKWTKIPHLLKTFGGGQDALDYLEGKGIYQDRAVHILPSLILLDLKMPDVSGLDVLRYIRSHQSLKRAIVVILSSSSLKAEVNQAYELGANSYVVKPCKLSELVVTFQSVYDYWIMTNKGPQF